MSTNDACVIQAMQKLLSFCSLQLLASMLLMFGHCGAATALLLLHKVLV
jgi:hypothetical protein